MTLNWGQVTGLTQLGALAYNEVPLPDSRAEGWRLVPGEELGLAHLFIGNYFNVAGWAQAFVAQDISSGDLVIVFRGTNDLGDVIADVTIALQGLVSLGYPAFQPLIDAVQAYSATAGPAGGAVSVYTTGHSLGGTLAELAWNDNRDWIDGGVGFGSPGSLPVPGPTSDDFIHISRSMDAIGRLQFSLGINLQIDDENFGLAELIAVGLASHNHDYYTDQVAYIANSPIADSLSLLSDIRVHWLNNNGGTYDYSDYQYLQPVLADYDAIVGGVLAEYVDMSGAAIGVVVDGSYGSDTLVGSLHNDVLSGGAGTDRLEGGAGNDDLWGGRDFDILDGGAGNDGLIGGGSNDRYYIRAGHGADIIDDRGNSSDIDTVRLYVGDTVGNFDAGWFTREGNDLRIRIPDGSTGYLVDVLIRNMNSTTGRIEQVELWTSDGVTRIDALDLSIVWAQAVQPGSSPSPTIEPPPTGAGPGLQTLTAGADSWSGSAGSDTMWGLSGNDLMNGLEGADTLLGGSGDDTLDGGSQNDLIVDDDNMSDRGVDLLTGGEGDDALVVSGGRDIVNPGSGNDTVYVIYSQLTDAIQVDYTFTNGIWRVHIFDGVTAAQSTNAAEIITDVTNPLDGFVVHGGFGDDYLYIQNGQNTLLGNEGNDRLGGGVGRDVLMGGAGDDVLETGWSGAGLYLTDVDWIDGGNGIDKIALYRGHHSVDIVYVGSAAATAGGYTILGGTHVSNVEQTFLTTGSGNDQVWDWTDNDTFVLREGDDFAAFTSGNDSVDFGGGFDSMMVDYRSCATSVYATAASLNGQSLINVTEGTDFTPTSRGVHAVDFEALTILGGSADDVLRGWVNADLFVGNAGADMLDGGEGDDELVGGLGDDILIGGLGNDYLVGDDGIDTASYAGAAAAVTVTLLRATAQDTRGAGDDTLLSIENLTGSAFGDTLIGHDSANVLRAANGNDAVSGLGGNDTLSGGNGDDVLAGGSGTDFINGEDGRDTVSAADDVAGVTVHLIGGWAQDGWGTFDTIIQMENIVGSNFADTLVGNNVANDIAGGGGDDWIVGLDGNDALEGGFGVNVLIGGDGYDLASYASQTANLWVNMAAGVYSAVGVWDVFYESIEGVRGGSGSDTIFGNTSANVLEGGLGDDALIGDAGGDFLNGGDGSDWLVGGDGADWIMGGNGVDVITAGAGADLFILGVAAGWDVAFDFNPNEDRFSLGGHTWSGFLTIDADGDGQTDDTLLGYIGGNFVALNVSGLSLAQWNALVDTGSLGEADADKVVSDPDPEVLPAWAGDDGKAFDADPEVRPAWSGGDVVLDRHTFARVFAWNEGVHFARGLQPDNLFVLAPEEEWGPLAG